MFIKIEEGFTINTEQIAAILHDKEEDSSEIYMAGDGEPFVVEQETAKQLEVFLQARSPENCRHMAAADAAYMKDHGIPA